MSTLYTLADEYITLKNMLDDEDISDEVFQDTLEGLEGEIQMKAEAYAILMKECEGESKKFGDEIARLTKKQNTYDHRKQSLKDHLKVAMEAMNLDKIETEHFKVAIQANGGIKPLIMDQEVNCIPEEYLTHPAPIANNKAIREALDNGIELPFAHLGERGTQLRIR